MLKRKMKLLISLLSIMVLALLSACGSAQMKSSNEAAATSSSEVSDYPNRPLNIIIPYAAGGSADLQARVIANYLQTELNQTVNVVSKPGGAGAVGMNYLKSQKPDGYNIILTAVGPSTLTPNANEVGYNTPEDFLTISQISDAPYGFAVNVDSKISTLEELLAYAKENPGKATYGTTGAGLHQHIVTTDFLNNIEGVDMEHIPFQGGAEAVSALLGNHTTAAMNTISEIMPHEQSGAMNILAVTSEERLEDLPDVPTFKELGYELIGTGAWFGFMAPKGTPEDIIQLLDNSIKEALEDPEVVKQFNNAGLPIAYLNSKDFHEKVVADYENNGIVIKNLQ